MPKDVDEVSLRRRDQLINEQIARHLSSSSQSRNVREVYPAHEFDGIVPHDAAKQYGNVALCEETEGNNSVPCASSQAEQAVYASHSTASANILPCNVIDEMETSECETIESIHSSNSSLTHEKYDLNESDDEATANCQILKDDVAECLRGNLQDSLNAWVSKYSIRHRPVNCLLQLLKQHGLDELPNDVRTLMHTPRNTGAEIISQGSGRYKRFDLITIFTREIRKCFSNIPSVIVININVDGLPLSKCSRSQFWPILILIKASFPTIKNISTLISKKTIPEKKTWLLCDVEVEKHCENLKKARNAANDIDHATTDEEKMGKGHRKQIAKKYSSDSSDTEVENTSSTIKKKALVPKVEKGRNCSRDPERASKTSHFNDGVKLNPKKQQSMMKSAPPTLEIDVESMPIRASNNNLTIKLPSESRDIEHETPFIHNNFDKNFNVIPDMTSAENMQLSNLLKCSDITEHIDCSERAFGDTGHPIVDLATGGRFHSTMTDSSVEPEQKCRCSCSEQCKMIIRMIASLQIDVTGLHEKLKRHEPRRHDNTDNSDARLIKQLLPIKDIATIEEFEKLVTTSDEAKSQFKAFILRIAGKNAKEMIERVFARVFSTSVASLVTWKGIRQNFGIHTLYIVEMIKDSVCDNFTDYSEADFEATAKEWVRLGKQRKEREDKAAEKGRKKP